MIVAGIDEAGYGPLLGPLVVTGVAFSVPDHLQDANLWDVLSASISRSPSRRDHRLPIADSKKLYNRKTGIAPLERSALAMLHTAGQTPQTLHSLLQILAPSVLGDLVEYPWYERLDTHIPTSTTQADIATRANAVQRNLTATGIKPIGIFTEVLPEGHFNRLVNQTHNKATVLLTLALQTVQRIIRSGDGQVRICVDRHGGRQYYVEKLLTYFEDVHLRVVEESDQRSAYTLSIGQRTLAIEFVTKGESHHLPIALASMFSKYVRELLMKAINAYFAQRIEGLKPTAGYYTDAKRFLADIEPVIQAEQLNRSMLVRSR